MHSWFMYPAPGETSHYREGDVMGNCFRPLPSVGNCTTTFHEIVARNAVKKVKNLIEIRINRVIYRDAYL